MIQKVRAWIENHFVTHGELILLHLETWPEDFLWVGGWEKVWVN